MTYAESENRLEVGSGRVGDKMAIKPEARTKMVNEGTWMGLKYIIVIFVYLFSLSSAHARFHVFF